MAKFFKGKVTGITGPLYVSIEQSAEAVTYEDPADDEIHVLTVRGKSCKIEVRTETDPSALVGTVATNVSLELTDAAGSSDKTYTLAKVCWTSCKFETSQTDSKPGQFVLSGVADWPS